MIIREKHYGTTLCHFNEKHDKLGRFAKKNGNSVQITKHEPPSSPSISGLNAKPPINTILDYGLHEGMTNVIDGSNRSIASYWKEPKGSKKSIPFIAADAAISVAESKNPGKLSTLSLTDKKVMADNMVTIIDAEMYDRGYGGMTIEEHIKLKEHILEKLDKVYDPIDVRNSIKESYRLQSEGNQQRPYAKVDKKTMFTRVSSAIKSVASKTVDEVKKKSQDVISKGSNAVKKIFTSVKKEGASNIESAVSAGKKFLSGLFK